jgi:hypothetical protein
MPSWGRRCPPTARALRRCAAHVAITSYFLLFTPYFPSRCAAYVATTPFPIAILRAGRHEFVGNRGESEIRAHLRGCAIPHTRRVPFRYALVEYHYEKCNNPPKNRHENVTNISKILKLVTLIYFNNRGDRVGHILHTFIAKYLKINHLKTFIQ